MGSGGLRGYNPRVPLAALIFDFDGTIIDTETPEVRAWQTIFRDHGAEFPDAYWMNAIGRGADQISERPIELLERLIGRVVDHGEIESEYERMRMADIDSQDCREGIRALVHAAQRAGVRLGVASSSKHQWVDRHLARLDLHDSFEAVLCADDVERAKPFPDLYIAACAALAVEPSETMAIEDSPNGIRAARKAGLNCVAVPNPCTVGMDLSEADLICDSVRLLSIDGIRNLMSR
jgi:HAD superfamily hydrolase (TIGR01509 family)